MTFSASSIATSMDHEIFRLCMTDSSVEALEFCLSRNPKAAQLESMLGSSPLHFVALNGTKKQASLLIRCGAEVTDSNYAEETPLHWAAKTDNLPLVKFFIQLGADVNADDETGCTPLHWAVEAGNYGSAQLLMEAGAMLLQNEENETPVTVAQHNGDIEMFRLLLRVEQNFV